MSQAAALCSFGGSLSGPNPLNPASFQPPAMTSSQTLTSPSHSPLSVAALTSTSKSETDLVSYYLVLDTGQLVTNQFLFRKYLNTSFLSCQHNYIVIYRKYFSCKCIKFNLQASYYHYQAIDNGGVSRIVLYEARIISRLDPKTYTLLKVLFQGQVAQVVTSGSQLK